MGEPGVDGGILGHREEQVTFTVELDLRERTLVAGEQNGTLLSIKAKPNNQPQRARRVSKRIHSDQEALVSEIRTILKAANKAAGCKLADKTKQAVVRGAAGW
jgi:predicted mannosyl-3-phosphoglycerate phosphatase (HAD superfamily)